MQFKVVIKLIIIFINAGILSNTNAQPLFQSLETSEQIQKQINFLTSTVEQQGFSYRATAGELSNLLLPMSYYSTPAYWGEYVCRMPNNNCDVLDIYNPNDYTLTPDLRSAGADLQVERINVANGSNIYDAATWQIALALAAKDNRVGINSDSLNKLAENQNKLLQQGHNGNAPVPYKGANRATTHPDDTFTYNGTKIIESNKAYFFRMVTRNWLSTDPLIGTPYQSYIQATGLPETNSEYQVGKVTWLDWKPITGENAWGFLLGPLQTAQLQYTAFPGTQNYIPFQSLAIQNALDVMGAFQAMQSEIGGIYYATAGALGNTGSNPINPYEISVENNASALAGLLVLEHVLQQTKRYDPTLVDSNKIDSALNSIHTLIYGGQMANGKTTEGILSFFKNYAWDKNNKRFLQGGMANQPGKAKWQPTYEPRAVDVATWGVTVLGQPLIDRWYGFGTAYLIWEDVKSWGGYYGPDKKLWGVGYSNQDNNGPSKNYKDGIISAEWTAGAITMVRSLITQYTLVLSSPSYTLAQKNEATKYIKSLMLDQSSMLQHLQSLRTDKYVTDSAYASVRPTDYQRIMPISSEKLAYLYASKRYFIPFGWYANPLPSTTSTAWAIMLHYNFNPFSVKGDYYANHFKELSC